MKTLFLHSWNLIFKGTKSHENHLKARYTMRSLTQQIPEQQLETVGR